MHVTEPLPTNKHARLAFGLDWRAYPTKGARAERRRYADDVGATHYVEIEVAGEVIGGFASPDTTGIGRTKLYSGAARIALHDRIKARPAALVLLQNEQIVHLVFVVRGAVRNDEVLSLEDARSRQRDLEKECRKANLQLTTFGSGPSIGAVDEIFGPSDLLSNRKSGRISKLPITIPTVLPLAVIGVALVVGVLKVMDFVSPPPKVSQPSWDEQYAQAVRSAFAAKQPLASQLAPALLTMIGRKDAVRKGWLVDHEDCGVQGNCTATYLRNGGTFADFDLDATPPMRPLQFMPDGRHLTTKSVRIPLVANVSLADEKKWPRLEELTELLQTPAQRLSVQSFELDSLGYKVTIDPPRPVFPGPVPPGPHGALVMVGTWQIEGYMWQKPLLARLPANMALISLTTTLKTHTGRDGNAGIMFVAKGKYYVLN